MAVDGTAPEKPPPAPGQRISDEALSALRDDFAMRRIGNGLRTLECWGDLAGAFDAHSRNAATVVGCLAEWVDAGYGRRRPEPVGSLLVRFDPQARRRLTLPQYVQIRLADGMSSMFAGEADAAIRHFDAVLAVGTETPDQASLVTANYWKSRCHRRRGEFGPALAHAAGARSLALALRREPMAAVVRVAEAWIYFLQERDRDAVDALYEAEAVLAQTDDYVSLGNIESTHARILRREGRYAQAVEGFARAAALYERRDPREPRLARALVDLASAQRLLANQFRAKIALDAPPRRRDSGSHRQPHRYGEKLRQLHTAAAANLDRAAATYEHDGNRRGLAAVGLHRGYLALHAGELDHARREAADAFAASEAEHDWTLVTRSRLLACKLENAGLERAAGAPADRSVCAQAALGFVREAVEAAARAQDQRLLGHAHTWHALTLLNTGSPERALEAMKLAASCLESRPGPRLPGDPVRDDFQTLKRRVLESAGVDPILLEWSKGHVGPKKFRELQQEFADFMIRRVWDQDGRKVSRAAATLSVSRSKVRQTLARAGLHKGFAPNGD